MFKYIGHDCFIWLIAAFFIISLGKNTISGTSPNGFKENNGKKRKFMTYITNKTEL